MLFISNRIWGGRENSCQPDNSHFWYIFGVELDVCRSDGKSYENLMWKKLHSLPLLHHARDCCDVLAIKHPMIRQVQIRHQHPLSTPNHVSLGIPFCPNAFNDLQLNLTPASTSSPSFGPRSANWLNPAEMRYLLFVPGSFPIGYRIPHPWVCLYVHNYDEEQVSILWTGKSTLGSRISQKNANRTSPGPSSTQRTPWKSQVARRFKVWLPCPNLCHLHHWINETWTNWEFPNRARKGEGSNDRWCLSSKLHYREQNRDGVSLPHRPPWCAHSTSPSRGEGVGYGRAG